jgi:tetratricopeptide (TPR) repeat protein
VNRDKIDSKLAEKVLTAILRARNLGADETPSWKAKALKLQGLVLEKLERGSEALVAYDEALSIDPKIGVKRRADALRKLG